MSALNLTQREALAARLADPALDLVGGQAGASRLAQLCDDALALAIDAAAADLNSAYIYLASGEQRDVWEGLSCVYKLARDDETMSGTAADHVAACIAEVHAYEINGYDDLQVAPCRLAWHASGVPIVVMERLDMGRRDPALLAGEWPDWANFVDCEQVAWSSLLGDWAVYDAGLSPEGCGGRGEREWRRSLAELRAAA